MHPFPIDAYAYANRLRSVHPGEKIAFAGATAAVCLISGSPVVALLAFAIVTLAVTRGAGISLSRWWYFVRIPAAFIVIGVATIAVAAVAPGDATALFSFGTETWRIGVTSTSLAQAAHTATVSLASVAATLFLALTTPVVDLTDQLKRWGVPVLFVELMVLVYRFVFVLLDTAVAMYTAQDARLGYSTRRRAVRSLALLASNLYLRAQSQAGAVFTALSARGYTGDLHVLADHPVRSARNALTIAAVELLLVVVAAGVRLSGIG
ncbi:MAG: cobalt ECF transporter T component CbiQ [Chloroflexi bacterium]|nr:cobalt ECF transporter T component CbiQ [Chloroflexota bacterium]